MTKETLPDGLTLLGSTAGVAFDSIGDFWVLLPTSTRWINVGLLERLAHREAQDD